MKKIVILTGAGIDVESGIPAFRSGTDALWENHKVEDVATIDGWDKNPELVLNFYNDRKNKLHTVEPNLAHEAIAKLEEKYDVTIVTTNVSNLHERAGSKKVLHLHGELTKMCSSLDTDKTLPYIDDIKLGDLHENGSQLRPFIVWFGELVPMLETTAGICYDADIFIICGTSLNVYPAADLINYVKDSAKKYVVDPTIPDFPSHFVGSKFIKIEEKASVGIPKLVEELLSK